MGTNNTSNGDFVQEEDVVESFDSPLLQEKPHNLIQRKTHIYINNAGSKIISNGTNNLSKLGKPLSKF